MSYFVRIKSRVFGPFDESQLLEMKSRGKITRSTEISENKHDWHSAETLAFLYGPANVTYSVSQPPANEPADWFYSINGTEGYGPVTASAIEQMLQSGQLSGNSYVWQQGQNARFIKNEPRFSSPGGDRNSLPADYESTGFGESMFRPCADSLGWLMCLKIVFLIYLIIQGLTILGGSIYGISFAIGTDRVSAFLIVLLGIIFYVAFYMLQFKMFLHFWKYHTVLNQAVVSRRESDLVQAQHNLFLFWKWTGIIIIAWLVITLLSVVIGIIIAGFGTGWLAG